MSKNHNIGCRPEKASLDLRCTSAEFGYAVDQTVPLENCFTSSGVGVYFPLAKGVDRNTVGITTSSAGAWLVANLTTGANVALTLASWEYTFHADRGWG